MESERTAILVGLGQKVQRIRLENGEQIRFVHVPDTQRAIEEIRARSPQLVVVDASLDKAASGGFTDDVLDRLPDFRSPVIIVKLEPPNPGLSIHEWNAANEHFITRTVPPERLRQEIERLCGQTAQATMRAEEAHEEIRSIGYNNCVERGKRVIHVQTEVLGEDEIMIKTTILEEGAVVDSIVQSCRQHQDDIVRSMKIAESQHSSALAKVKRGKYD